MDLAVKLGRPNNYRMEMTDHKYFTNVIWSTGQGNFVMSFGSPPRKESSRSLALGALVGDGFAFVTDLFFNVADGTPAYLGKDWCGTNGAEIPGQPCYILAGTIFFQKDLVWVNKATFLIQQVQFEADGNTNASGMDDATIKAALTAMNSGQAATPANIADFKKEWVIMTAGKITITETYPNIQTNVPIALAEFEPQPSATAPTGQPPAESKQP